MKYDWWSPDFSSDRWTFEVFSGKSQKTIWWFPVKFDLSFISYSARRSTEGGGWRHMVRSEKHRILTKKNALLVKPSFVTYIMQLHSDWSCISNCYFISKHDVFLKLTKQQAYDRGLVRLSLICCNDHVAFGAFTRHFGNKCQSTYSVTEVWVWVWTTYLEKLITFPWDTAIICVFLSMLTAHTQNYNSEFYLINRLVCQHADKKLKAQLSRTTELL